MPPRKASSPIYQISDDETPRHRLRDPLPEGEIIVDNKNRPWRIGRSIGSGGFGEIFLASNNVHKRTPMDTKYVVKVEPYLSGPLFTEMHFYYNVGQAELISKWMEKKKMKFLGMPKLIGSGIHSFKDHKYRFLVIERFSEDLQSILNRNDRVFPVKTVFTIGLKMLDVLEYIHSRGYVHCDLKAANIMIGYGKNKQHDTYLVDFGLSCKYIVHGKHKEYKEDKRKAHDGTIEFTSRDAHVGAHSRRSDLEVLAYNMLQWLCRKLPWEDNLRDFSYVNIQKINYMKNIPKFMEKCFKMLFPPPGITEFFKYIATLGFEDKPDYEKCRHIFISAIKACRFSCDGKLIYTSKRLSPIYLNRKRPLINEDRFQAKVSKMFSSETASIVQLSAKASSCQPYSFSRKRGKHGTLLSPCGPSCDNICNTSVSPAPRLTSKAPLSPNFCFPNELGKPTPAMLEVVKRRAELLKSMKFTNRNSWNSKAKSRKKRSKRKFSVRGKRESPQAKNRNNNESDVIENIKPKVRQVKKYTSTLKSKGTLLSPYDPSCDNINSNTFVSPALRLSSEAPSSPDFCFPDELGKPTPAMLEVIKRRAELLKSLQLANRNSVNSKPKSRKKRFKRRLSVKGKRKSPQANDSNSNKSDVVENIKPKISHVKKNAPTKSKVLMLKTSRSYLIVPRM